MSNLITINLDDFIGKSIYDLKKHIVDEISNIEVRYDAPTPVDNNRIMKTPLFEGDKDYRHRNGYEKITSIHRV